MQHSTSTTAQMLNKAGFRSLFSWQEAKKLSLDVYEITKSFPASERFHLVDQLRRASSSVMSNLAEGSAMSTRDHQNSFYVRAKGSAIEVDNFIELAFPLGYITENEYHSLSNSYIRLSGTIERLIRSPRRHLRT